MEGGGFEPPKLARQIYSLIPLATREPLQKEALDSAHETNRCQLNFGNKKPAPPSLSRGFYQGLSIERTVARRVLSLISNFYGAATKSRTRDLLITNQLLYQLSYRGSTLKIRLLIVGQIIRGFKQ